MMVSEILGPPPPPPPTKKKIIHLHTHTTPNVLAVHYLNYTGWPRKNATLTINNLKKTWEKIKKLCTLMHIEFSPQQNDTKIINIDEGVLILWPFSEAMSFSIFATFVS